MNRQFVAAILISLSLGLPSYAASGVAPADVTPASDHDAWVERIVAAQESMDQANQRYTNAVQAYVRMRHRRRQRGERKAAVLLEQENARDEAAEATHTLEQTLEAARRAGVPPGWVREALAKSAAPAQLAH
jgi:inorganic triphosphatase YgiF